MGAAPDTKKPRFLLWVFLLYALACAVLLALRGEAVALHDFLDADDQLRLVEVRDWLAGQSFYDVTQYRMNLPWGAPMHWSRLVDLPLAGLILALRPILGPESADMITAAVVPLLTLGVIMLLAALIGKRLAGNATGIIAALFCTLSLSIMIQVVPLRVDHHGWTLAMALLALFHALGDKGFRSGALSAAAIAIALQISLEALPFALALGAVFALRWVFSSDPDQKQGLRGFALGLLGCAFLLTALLHTPGDWLKVYCDSVSLPHLVAIAISGLGVTWLLLLDPAKRWVRLGGLAVIGLAAAAAYHAFPPGCTLDAFSQLEPNVRTLWYERTLEGLPVWRLPTVLASSTIGFPIVGVLCAALACKWSSPESRPMWATYCFLMVSALCVALMVQRAGALANAMAAPAAAWALVGAINALKDSRSALVRVLGLTFVAFALSPLGPVSAVAAFSKPDPDAVQRNASKGGRSCTTTEQIKALSALPAARVFAPLDLGPTILLNTPHAPVASGHHRNHVAMNDVITAFVSDDDAAHAIIRRRATPFVLMCSDTAEVELYAKHAPNGFAAHLAHGQTPQWLEPVPVRGSSLRVWRVIS